MVASVPLLTRRTRSTAGNRGDDQFGEFGFGGGGGTITGPTGGRVADGFDDGGVGVTDGEGPPGEDVVDVLVAVRVPEVGSEGAVDEERGSRRRCRRRGQGY